MVNVLERLSRLQLVMVTGKGGVGKSVISAVLGSLLAGGGRSVLLLEVDPRENLHRLFDHPPSGGEPIRVDARLHLQHLEPRSILDDLVAEKLKVGMLVRRVLESPIHRHFTEGAPGLKEAAVFGRVLRLVEGHVPRGTPRPDLVVLDAPATGHGVSWLAAPQLVADVIRSGPIGQMAEDISRFLADRNRFGTVVVSSAEEMPVQESVELLDELESRFDRAPEVVVVNGLYPPHPEVEPVDPVERLWRDRRRINELQLERLRARWTGPLVELPLLPVDPGPDLVFALRGRLRQGLEAAS